jgi:hypothetical protein
MPTNRMHPRAYRVQLMSPTPHTPRLPSPLIRAAMSPAAAVRMRGKGSRPPAGRYFVTVTTRRVLSRTSGQRWLPADACSTARRYQYRAGTHDRDTQFHPAHRAQAVPHHRLGHVAMAHNLGPAAGGGTRAPVAHLPQRPRTTSMSGVRVEGITARLLTRAAPGQPPRDDQRALVGWPHPPLRVRLTALGADSLSENRR